jgi:alpha-acetolactate decarboxylase
MPVVRVWGALRAIMHEGKTGPNVALSEVAAPHVYGVGALSGLRGEILILDGVAFTAMANGGGLTVRPSPTETATLLVAAAVPSWKAVPLSSPIGAEELDDRLEAMAREQGFDVDKPFPLVIEGSLVDLEWHVLAGASAATVTTHADHMRNAVTGKLVATPATVVGFFSKHHEGVFTHMGQRTHFHVMTADQRIMGHVDRLALRAGGTLKLPGQ